MSLLKVMHVVCLSILIKSIEEYSYAGTEKLKALSRCGVLPDDEIYKKVEIQNEQIIGLFKKRSIATIIALHPEYFRPTVEFKDWESAMVFMHRNKKIGQTFLS